MTASAFQGTGQQLGVYEKAVPRAQARNRYPDEFKEWVRYEHSRWARIRDEAQQQFGGIALHVKHPDGEDGTPLDFSRPFAAFIDRAIKARQSELYQDGWENAESRYQRLERAMVRLAQRRPRLERVVRFYQSPLRKEEESVIALARALSVPEREPTRMLEKGIRELWEEVGCFW